MFFTRIAPLEAVPQNAALIPEYYAPDFLNALLELAKAKQSRNRQNPVSTHDSAGMQLRVENRQREMARLVGIILAASTLIEPELHDIDLIDQSVADLDAYLEEDHGWLESQARHVVRSAAA